MQMCDRSIILNLLYNSDMNAKIFIALVLLLCLAHSTAPPQANPNCTTPFCTTCAVPATCDVCDGQYYLNANTCTSCNSAITNCVNCTYNAVVPQVECSLCDVNAYPVGILKCVTCVTDVPDCLSCTNDGTTTTCTVCNDGFFLSGPNTCTPCGNNIKDCISCDPLPVAPFATCKLCIPNSIVDNLGNCVACSLYINECNICDQVAKTCTTCADGYFRKNSGADCAACTDLVSNCASCVALDDAGSAITCNKCQLDTFLVANACVTCGTFIVACDTCNNGNSTCDACKPGYFRFGSGVSCNLCSGSITNCATCDATDDAGLNVVCSKCLTDFFLKGNTCVDCGQFIASCTTCNNGNNTCDVCLPGNFRDAQGTQCSTCDSRITGCTTCAATDDTATTVTCSACSAGLFLLNNQCVTCDLFIIGCTNTGCNAGNNTCDTCISGDYRKDQGQVCDLCNNAIANCETCNALDDLGTNVQCTKCVPNSFTVGNTCEACAVRFPSCDICDIVNNACTTCSVGFYRKNSGQNCNPCSDYDAFCTNCVSIDDAGTGITCSACIANTFLVGTVCQACGTVFPNCLTCTSQTVCATCVPSYYATLIGDACKVCSEVTDCLTCKNNNQDAATCITCGNSLVVKDNICVSCSAAIADCDLCVQDATSMEITCNGCGNGKVLADDKLSCQDSSSSTIIIVSAVVGGVVLLGAGFAIFKCMKKRKSPLLEEDYEKI